jgi:hypothetical protein
MPGWILRQAMHCPREPAPPPAAQGFASLVLRVYRPVGSVEPGSAPRAVDWRARGRRRWSRDSDIGLNVDGIFRQRTLSMRPSTS